MRSSSRMPPSFLLLLERAPKPDAKITRTFSLSIFSRLCKAKAVREERDVIYFCADGLKFCFFFLKKATAFFFFLSFFRGGNFSLAFFSQRKEQPINFSSVFFQAQKIYTYTRRAAFQQNTVYAFCAREREIQREIRGCFEDDDDAFFPFSSFLSLLSLFDDDGFDDGGE